MDSGKIILKFPIPLSVQVSKKKNFILNLNAYRNAHYMTLNRAKELFHGHIKDVALWNEEPIDGLVQMHYKCWRKTRALYDEMNVLSILDKFTCDGLIEAGVLKDDNRLYVKTPTFEHMGVDKENPRCEVSIRMVCTQPS